MLEGQGNTSSPPKTKRRQKEKKTERTKKKGVPKSLERGLVRAVSSK